MPVLEGSNACVAGAASGIGRAIATALAMEGAVVTCLDIDTAGAKQTANDITAGGAAARHARCDVRDSAEVTDALQACGQAGPLNIAVVTPGINIRKPMLDYTDEDYRAVLDVNLTGSFNVLRAGARIMAGHRQGGAMLAISSISSRVVEPNQVVYAATKAALAQLVRVAAAELGPHGIRVNAIAPGPAETALTVPILADTAWRDAYANRTAVGRWARPMEIAAPAVFLCSPAASYVTGEVMYVDGGTVDMSLSFQAPEPVR